MSPETHKHLTTATLAGPDHVSSLDEALARIGDGTQNKHPKTLKEAIFTKGVIAAIAYAANHPGVVVDVGSDEYAHLMDAFQEWIPRNLIDCNQWWLGHYWSNGHTCSKCREVVQAFPHDVRMTDQQIAAITPRAFSGHAPDCSARNASSFDGLKICLSFHSLPSNEEIMPDQPAAPPTLLEAAQRVYREMADGDLTIGAMEDLSAAIIKAGGTT